MLATAEYSDIRCWPCHYCTVLFIVLSLGHNLQMSTRVLFADTVLYTNFYGSYRYYIWSTSYTSAAYRSLTTQPDYKYE